MKNETLSTEHREMLELGSAITPEVIEARGYRTIEKQAELRSLKFSTAQCRVPGLLVPIHPPDASAVTHQFRPDSPRTDKKGKTMKYEVPKGSGVRIDCPPPCRSLLKDPSVPIWISEGAKKADSLASFGVCAIDLPGVWGFKGKNALGGVTVLADLDVIAWNDRKVFIVFDSDVMTKRGVRKALARLTELLRRRGAKVWHVYLPGGPNGGKVGVDDFLAAGHSVKDLEALAVRPEAAPKDAETFVLDQLPDAPVSPQARVPRPYRLKSSGLYVVAIKEDKLTGTEFEEERIIAYAPIVMTARLRDADSDEFDIKLAWQTSGVWDQALFRRDMVLDHRKLPSAALNGLPLTSLNAKDVTAYLAAYENLNLAAIPKVLVTRRCGWREVNEKPTFVLGSRIIGNNSLQALQTNTSPGELIGEEGLRLVTDNSGTLELVSALRPGGSLAAWLDAVRLIERFPRAMLAIYGALTAPLLYVLEAPNFIIDYCGDTSIGKTTVQNVAASVWGYPSGGHGGLVVAWNATQVFTERYAELLNDLPIILEDSQTGDPRSLARAIYMLANGVGRGRGSPRGLRGVTRWRGVTISSGERPLSSVTQDGGATARTITMWGPPFGSRQEGELVRKLSGLVNTNFGHAGPTFIEWLLEYQIKWEEFRVLYKSLTDTLAARFPGNVGDRYARYFAAMLMAGTLATPVLGLPGDPELIISAVMEELAEPQAEADTPRRALEDILAWATSNRSQFEGMDDSSYPPRTYLGRWEEGQYIAVFRPIVRRQLQQMGYDPAAIFRSWRERGWLRVQEDRLTFRVRVRGLAQHMVTIDWIAVEEAASPVMTGV